MKDSNYLNGARSAHSSSGTSKPYFWARFANSSAFFLPAFEEKLKKEDCQVPVLISSDNEIAALLGATTLIYKEYFAEN